MIVRELVLVAYCGTLLLAILRCTHLQSVVFTEKAEILKAIFPFYWIWTSAKLRSTQMQLSVPGCPSGLFNFPFWWITHVKYLIHKYNDYYIIKKNVFTNWKLELYMERLWRDLNNFLKLILAVSDDVWLLLCMSVVTAIIFSSLSSTGVFVGKAFPLTSYTVKNEKNQTTLCYDALHSESIHNFLCKAFSRQDINI